MSCRLIFVDSDCNNKIPVCFYSSFCDQHVNQYLIVLFGLFLYALISVQRFSRNAVYIIWALHSFYIVLIAWHRFCVASIKLMSVFLSGSRQKEFELRLYSSCTYLGICYTVVLKVLMVAFCNYVFKPYSENCVWGEKLVLFSILWPFQFSS